LLDETTACGRGRSRREQARRRQERCE